MIDRDDALDVDYKLGDAMDSISGATTILRQTDNHSDADIIEAAERILLNFRVMFRKRENLKP